MDRNDVARNLYEIMQRKNISVKALAEAIDVDNRTIYRYMEGTSSIPEDRLFEIADALSVKAHEFFAENN